MADSIDKNFEGSPRKFYYLTQLSLRFVAIGVALAAAWIMMSDQETTVVYGIQMEARYTYAPAFKFLAIANLVAVAFSVLSVIVAFIAKRMTLNPAHFYVFFLHDLMITLLMISACGASTAIAYTGKYGNSHVGWMGICDHFSKFCNKVQASLILTYLAFFLYLVLTLVSANKLMHLRAD